MTSGNEPEAMRRFNSASASAPLTKDMSKLTPVFFMSSWMTGSDSVGSIMTA